MDKKYILILGDKLDSTIDIVIDWINFYGFRFIRIDIREIEEYKNISLRLI